MAGFRLPRDLPGSMYCIRYPLSAESFHHQQSGTGEQHWQQHCQGWNQFGVTGVFFSVPRYDWCAPLSHPASRMIVNHGPSLQSSKEECKPGKWGYTAIYYVSLTKAMLAKKSEPRSGRQSDHTKPSWPSWRDANCSGMVMSFVHQVWPKPSCKAEWKGEEDKTDKRTRWEDSIREQTGLEFAKSHSRAVENREKWRKLVVKSSVVLQRPWRLRIDDDDDERGMFSRLC